MFVDQLAITTSKSHSYQVEGKAAIAPAIVVNPVSVSESLVMNEVKNIELKIKNEGGSTLDWSLKGATGMSGKSFSLGRYSALNTSLHWPREKSTRERVHPFPCSVEALIISAIPGPIRMIQLDQIINGEIFQKMASI